MYATRGYGRCCCALKWPESDDGATPSQDLGCVVPKLDAMSLRITGVTGHTVDVPEDLMVSLSNHEVERVEGWCHDLVLRQAQDEVY